MYWRSHFEEGPSTRNRSQLIIPWLVIALGFVAVVWPGSDARVGDARPLLAALPANEVRALWVVRNTLTSPEKIHSMVERASAAGFNTLIVQVRGRGDAYYQSRWEPRAVELKDQPQDFDPLAVTIAEAHQRGLKVHAWLNTSLLANLDALPNDPKHVYNAHPEWLAVPRAVASELFSMSPGDSLYRQRIVEWSKANRSELEGVYTGPANPKVREHIHRVWMDIIQKYPVDGMHFVIVSAAVFANDENAFTRRFQDWRRWLGMGILDVACPMAYTPDTAIFQKQIEVATSTAHAAGRRVWAGIGAYRIPAESTVEKINTARTIGAEGIILFSYDFTATPSALNPQGDYLERVRRAAFDLQPVPK